MKALIEKYTSGKFNVVLTFYQLLWEVDSTAKQAEFSSMLLAAYHELNRDLMASGGPFLLGQQFTLADIALIPFIQRAILLLGHYKGFKVPQGDAWTVR